MSYNENRWPATVAPRPPTTDSGPALLRPELDRLFRVLGNRHRRLILMSMKEGVVETIDDVIRRDGDETGTSKTRLIHTHLPKLEDAGYIEWDRTRGEISRGPRFEEIEPFLELLETHSEEIYLD